MRGPRLNALRVIATVRGLSRHRAMEELLSSWSGPYPLVTLAPPLAASTAVVGGGMVHQAHERLRVAI